MSAESTNSVTLGCISHQRAGTSFCLHLCLGTDRRAYWNRNWTKTCWQCNVDFWQPTLIALCQNCLYKFSFKSIQTAYLEINNCSHVLFPLNTDVTKKAVTSFDNMSFGHQLAADVKPALHLCSRSLTPFKTPQLSGHILKSTQLVYRTVLFWRWYSLLPFHSSNTSHSQ